MMDAYAIHATLGANGWLAVLQSAGIDEQFLRDKHGPCPICGGTDRYRFDNKRGRGDWICNQCGAGDGFKLVMGVFDLRFKDARIRVMEWGGLTETETVDIPRPASPEPIPVAKPTQRVIALLRETCAIEDCEPARRYLQSRSLWPLPQGHSLRAHTSVQYWQEGRRIGKFQALIAPVRDLTGDLVTAHVTYLEPNGRKLEGYEARKLLSPMTGREGCAVPLMRLDGNTLGIAEGIETALSAARIEMIPVWAALNTSLLSKFEPPEDVHKLVIFADRDIAGLDAATKLMQRLQEKVRLEIRTPSAKDWNDVLMASDQWSPA